MSVATQVRLVVDRVAKGVETSLASYNGGTDFWTLVDAAQDETFENTVKGSDLTAVDARVLEGMSWSDNVMKKMFQALDAYAVTQGKVSFTAWLATTLALRISKRAANAYYQATGKTPTPGYTFPQGVLVAGGADPTGAGMHTFGTYESGAISGTEGALPATEGPAAIMAVNLGAAATVGASFTCTNFNATSTKSIALSLSGATQYTQTILGQQALAAGVSAGDTGLQVSSTAAFTPGEYAIVWESDALQEVVLISSLATGPTRLVVPALKNAYTTAAKVWPLFSNVVYGSGASGSGQVALYARPDRIVAL